MFLRFFCPAVTSPEAYGIVDGMLETILLLQIILIDFFNCLTEPPSPESRRLLILMTKVLQNLSNDVEFGLKEPHMAKLNDFIHSNREKLDQFFKALVVSRGGRKRVYDARQRRVKHYNMH